MPSKIVFLRPQNWSRLKPYVEGICSEVSSTDSLRPVLSEATSTGQTESLKTNALCLLAPGLQKIPAGPKGVSMTRPNFLNFESFYTVLSNRSSQKWP